MQNGQLTGLVAEYGQLFGSRMYRHYTWLLSLSDHVAHFGLEHHESSDNRREERAHRWDISVAPTDGGGTMVAFVAKECTKESHGRQ